MLFTISIEICSEVLVTEVVAYCNRIVEAVQVVNAALVSIVLVLLYCTCAFFLN